VGKRRRADPSAAAERQRRPLMYLFGLDIDYYDERRRVLLEARLWELGQELLELGQSFILENGFSARQERDELRLAARALGVP
jgi:predicted kinase